MKKLDSAPCPGRGTRLAWLHLMLAGTLALGLGTAQGAVAATGESGEKAAKPVLTKSARKAALAKAAAAILRAPASPLVPVGGSPGAALLLTPSSSTDERAVPHYYGPFPNWANSPYTLPDVAVAITGDGAGATAVATVGAGGAVAGITITNPGSGYTAATVAISGGGAGAAADATVGTSSAVTGITVDLGGSGYAAPLVTIAGGGTPTTPATATAYGGVDAVALLDAGSGYSNPTIDFDLPDGPDGVKAVAHAVVDADTGTILGVVVDQPGSGYSFAPNVVIRDGTIFDPIRNNPGHGAAAAATLLVQSVVLNVFGAGYSTVPTVSFTDAAGAGSGAAATALTGLGGVTAVNLTAAGSGYLTAGGMKKFQDRLPLPCNPSIAGSCAAAANNLGQYLPLAVPDTTTFSGDPTRPDADYYVIAVVQHREKMHSSLPPTLLREYVQLETPANASWSRHVALRTELPDGTSVPTLMPDGSPAIAVDDPHLLGPLIAATKDRPVRIVFYNLLPVGSDGDLFLPTDATIMGAGPHPGAPDELREPLSAGTVLDAVRNPVCAEYPKGADCFKDNRATLHLHGGITPWISDGTPHQWITPAGEGTAYPQGVAVGNVPDMAPVAGVPDCTGEADGCQTYYYTNQQSARLLFYHDHAWGITRLNVYAGEAAGYLITDPTDQRLLASGILPVDQIPLIIQDRTFVPQGGDGVTPGQLELQDPTWDTSRWGGYGNLWYHHVYMPAQNPGDPSGMSAFGRWMYGSWFWPPAVPLFGPIANPYYTGACNLDDPATWDYATDPFCEPPLIPGTPNISVGMEQFNDTPVVNGTAYPTTTVQPKPYRFRILNAANDRFWNLQWYVADPGSETDPATGPTEVALKPAELAAAQYDPNVFPTPDTSVSPAGPDWIQIGSEGGFLPAPVVVPNQPITWINNPARFDVGNVDRHALLVSAAERADVIVDFSRYAGKTLILYNDAPAPFPARGPTYDYYTGGPDQSPSGPPTTLPGFGPNTRTIMQVKVAAGSGTPFNLAALQAAFRHKADGSGVFESGQHPIIVGQAAYNSAYGTGFAASGYCNGPGETSTVCDGYARIADQGGTLFGFNTLLAPEDKLQLPVESKGIHDEMNSAAFDEFGRMTANMGVEVVPASPVAQNFVLYPYVNPVTELIDATNLPKGEIGMTPIASADGTQIWKITHNGVDTHPLHWHLYDVQVLNRVTWDNIILPPDPEELGWKETVRVSPLEDTIVALRPIIPVLPFDLPNSIRPLHPMMPLGSTMGFNNIDAAGNPTAPIVNQLVNFGLEYAWHCHILSHEEMDMMRPVSVALPPNAPDGLSFSIAGSGTGRRVLLAWNDTSLNETSFLVQRTTTGLAWTDVGTIVSPLELPNDYGPRALRDARSNATTPYLYRVVAFNDVGYGGQFMSLSVQSTSPVLGVNLPAAPPAAPTLLTATLQAGRQVRLSWRDNAENDVGFVVQRSADGVTFTQIATTPAHAGIGNFSFVDTAVPPDGATYTYWVAAFNLRGTSTISNIAAVPVPHATLPPTGFTAMNGADAGVRRSVVLNWADNADNETGFRIQRATNPKFTRGLTTVTLAANATTLTQVGLPRNRAFYYRIRALNGLLSTGWVGATPFPARTNP